MTSSDPAPPPDPADPRPRRRRRRIALAVALGVLLLGCLLWAPIARALPGLLIERQAPRTADAMVVLAGDSSGGRVDHAAELVRHGYLPQGPIVMSGGPIYGDLSWAALMRDRAVAHGVPRARIRLQERSTTTAEDASLSLALLPPPAGEKPVILLVTSAWHSGRAAAHFRSAAGDRYEIVSCPAPDPPAEWWRSAVETRALATEVLKRLWPGPGG